MKHKSPRYLALTVGVLALAAGFTAQAEASTFFYSVTGGFEIPTASHNSDALGGVAQGGVEFFGPVPPNNVAIFPPGPPPPNTFTTVGWGCNSSGSPATCAANGDTNITFTDPFTSSNRSALKVTTFNGAITDNGVPVVTSELFLHNKLIAGNSLNSVHAVTNLRISTNPDFQDFNALAITFHETLNAAPCAPPNPLLSVCADFLTFAGGPFESLVITSGGQQFRLTVDVATDDPRVFIDRSNPAALVVFMGEDQDTHLFVTAALTAVVPEPASLVLVGASLIGFVGFHAMRRSHSTTSQVV